MAKFITAMLSIIVIAVIGVFLLQQADHAAAERRQAEIVAQQQADREAAVRLKSATRVLDAAMKNGTAGLAGTVVTRLRADKNQIDAVIAAIKLTASTSARSAPAIVPAPGPATEREQ